MKLILSSQAKKMEDEQQDDQDNICNPVRQKQAVGCIIRGFIIFTLQQMIFAVMELTKMTKWVIIYAVII
jgi:hypothetical protein